MWYLVGCVKCGYFGYVGWCGVYELLVIDDLICLLIYCNVVDVEIFVVGCVEGMCMLCDDVECWFVFGVMLFEEVLCVMGGV